MQNLLIHLDNLGISRCPIPVNLFNTEDEDEEIEGVDGDQLLQKLAGRLNILISPDSHS